MLHWTGSSGEDEFIVQPRTLIIYDVDDDDNDGDVATAADNDI